MNNTRIPPNLWFLGAAIQASLATAVAEPISRTILNAGFDAGRLLLTFLLATSGYLLGIPMMQALPKNLRGTFGAWSGIATVSGAIISVGYLAAHAIGFFPNSASSAVVLVVLVTAATGGVMTWVMSKIT